MWFLQVAATLPVTCLYLPLFFLLPSGFYCLTASPACTKGPGLLDVCFFPLFVSSVICICHGFCGRKQVPVARADLLIAASLRFDTVLNVGAQVYRSNLEFRWRIHFVLSALMGVLT